PEYDEISINSGLKSFLQRSQALMFSDRHQQVMQTSQYYQNACFIFWQRKHQAPENRCLMFKLYVVI
ncbi:hypothetical protein, partial [Neisseria sp.]|uniref:hypothetical protein n=1 Tax=Neisseria sp. TaxID=192066 RepID=UPI0028A02705